MARCCGGGTCACNITAGSNITVSGIGSSNDPFVIAADVALAAVDSAVFDVNLSGLGTVSSPWGITVGYAGTARLDDVPDVNAPAPTNAQVLGWDSATSKWTPRAPTTAASGSVTHDTSLSGDGSGGSPLQVVERSGGFLSTTASGLGLTDPGINGLVRKFADAAARAVASPSPILNTLSALDDAPGKVDYWTGSQWAPVKTSFETDGASNELLALSGPYVNGRPVTMMVRNFSGTTDASGSLTVLGAASLAGRAGILSATIGVTGAQSYIPTLAPAGGELSITARRLDDGALLAAQAITGQVTAYLY